MEDEIQVSDRVERLVGQARLAIRHYDSHIHQLSLRLVYIILSVAGISVVTVIMIMLGRFQALDSFNRFFPIIEVGIAAISFVIPIILLRSYAKTNSQAQELEDLANQVEEATQDKVSEYYAARFSKDQ